MDSKYKCLLIYSPLPGVSNILYASNTKSYGNVVFVPYPSNMVYISKGRSKHSMFTWSAW